MQTDNDPAAAADTIMVGLTLVAVALVGWLLL